LIPILAAQIAEATWLHLPHDMGVIAAGAVEILLKEIEPYTALLLGPGWGKEKATAEFLEALLGGERADARRRSIGFLAGDAEVNDDTPGAALPPLVIDADGLNLLAEMENWTLPADSILTPHPGEMARLCGVERDAVQQNRVEMARERAAAWRCVVVLKGAYTVVAAPDGRVCMMPFATSALATAGTGDVLAGAIVGLRAQGLSAFDAAVVGAYLHGLAGEMATEALGTPASVVAGDVGEMLIEALSVVEAAVG
jgi:NAD(P)H-hydrate epimerase